MNNELVKLDLDLDNDVGADTRTGADMSGLETSPVWRSSWTIYHRADRRSATSVGAVVDRPRAPPHRRGFQARHVRTGAGVSSDIVVKIQVKLHQLVIHNTGSSLVGWT